ncbi:MAG: 30S ribosomal protein S12 methylthiotransferase RimO [Leptospirillia bacterium]
MKKEISWNEKTVGIVSLGCPKNSSDTERMISDLSSRGYQVVPDLEKAEILLVNTCSFVTDARRESVETLLELSRYKEEGKARFLVGAGCLVSRYRDQMGELIPEIDLALTTFDEHRLGEILDSVGGGGIAPAPIRPSLFPLSSARLTPPHRAYVKVSEGCDHPCTFCSIPLARGAQVSRPPGEVLAEIRDLGARGTQEVTLIAQDLTRYGHDLGLPDGLADLLERIDGEGGVPWVRLLYAYPTLVTERLLSVMSRSRTVLPYLDIPLQHVEERILGLMKRPGNVDFMKRLVDRVRTALPGVVLRTTFITGFPGETEEEFQSLMEFAEWARFDHVGVFAFSREEGTPSHDLPGQIPHRIRMRRRKDLLALCGGISLEKNRALEGQVVPVLIEGLSEQSDLVLSGRTKGMAPDGIDGEVLVLSGQGKPGEIVDCRIVRGRPFDLEAWEVGVPELPEE